MIIIGHRYINFTPFYRIKTVEEIRNTPPNTTLLFDFNETNVELCRYCQQNNLNFALTVQTLRDVIFANALQASFILCEKALAPQAQKLAQEYLFDAKILLITKDEREIDLAAENGIDGIIFKEGVKS